MITFKFWLIVFFYVNGNWVPGSQYEIQGYSPRLQSDWKTCIERRNSAMKVNDSTKVRYVCRKEMVVSRKF